MMNWKRTITMILLAAVMVLAAVAPAWAAGSADYTVQPGDTLTKIAARYGLTVGQILDANPAITDSSRLAVGQVISLPPGRSEGYLPGRPKRLFRWEVEQNGGRIVKSDQLYLVRAGDNYLRVCARFGISVEAFFAANPQLFPGSSLRKGELVYIPVELLHNEGVYTFYETP